MNPVPMVVVALAAVAVGAYMLTQFLRDEARKPIVIGIHIILAVASLEGVVSLLHEGAPGVEKGRTAALLMAAALFTAFTSAVLRGRGVKSATPIFYAHTAFGAAGALLLVAWAGAL
jgi:hypothetical protein